MLFDIDGTLVDSAGAGLRALHQGFFDAFPQKEPERFPDLDLAGATDSGIAACLFRIFEIENTRENLVSFYQSYLHHLRRGVARIPPENGGLLPGVERLLSVLRKDGEYVLGLLTGNIAEGARIKTERFGLGGVFDFGAFGDDHPDRNELGPIALQRAEAVSGARFSPEQVIIIGDSPRDIECARASGFSVLAVATGQCTLAELDAHSPDHLFQDMKSTAEILALFETI